jgi:hypothetical protein
MSIALLTSPGGTLQLPDRSSVLLDRAAGGNLVVLPPRPVWERSELDPPELAQWGYLIAAAGRALLDVLPQLKGGCINYWEAGNWALNDQAEPHGRKRAEEHRSVHLHLLGRSPASTDPAWAWGESPVFPRFAERMSWSAGFERLTPEECVAIANATRVRLETRYQASSTDIKTGLACALCSYPSIKAPEGSGRCEECS